MYQTLFTIPNEIAGVRLLGMGLLLAVWAVASVVWLAWLMRRQGLSGDTWGYVPLLLLVGAIIAWLLPWLAEPQGLPIRGYGVMMLIAVLSGVGLAAWRARRRGLDPDMIYSLAFWTFVPGIIGARLFFVIEFWHTDYQPAFDVSFFTGLAKILKVSEGGLVVFGSLIGAMVGLTAFVIVRRLPFRAVCDLVAPSLALGQAIGRIGCLMNGCCFGGPCDHLWAIQFPPEAIVYQVQAANGQFFGITIGGGTNEPPTIERIAPDSPFALVKTQPGDRILSIDGYPTDTADQARAMIHDLVEHPRAARVRISDRPEFLLPAIHPPARSLPVQPTQAMSAIDAFVLCLLLLALDPFLRRDGQLFGIALGLHAISRFLLEIIRVDEASVFGTGMSISQNISVLLLLAGVAMLVWAQCRPAGRTFSKAGSVG